MCQLANLQYADEPGTSTAIKLFLRRTLVHLVQYSTVNHEHSPQIQPYQYHWLSRLIPHLCNVHSAGMEIVGIAECGRPEHDDDPDRYNEHPCVVMVWCKDQERAGYYGQYHRMYTRMCVAVF
jgi:hypothetical protein